MGEQQRVGKFGETRGDPVQVDVVVAGDIVLARQRGRDLALELGFSGSEVTLIAAAVSEIARNMVEHAAGGVMSFERTTRGRRRGIQIVARDQGPGIPNVAQAMQYGFSSGDGCGLGLPAARWLMDEFLIASKVGAGTTVTMKKWLTATAPAEAAAPLPAA